MSKTELKHRIGQYYKLLPETVEAIKAVSEMFNMTEVEVIELGLMSVFKATIEIVSEDIGVATCG